MKNRFNSNVIKIVITFVLLLTIIMGLFFAKTFESANEKMRNYVVALNEIEVLTGKENSQELDEKISELQKDLLNEVDKENHSEERTFLIYLYFAAIGFVVILFSYIYFSVIRPFKKLNMFAGEISKGNMDRPLAYERNNMFGSFTWAFDSMRREIKKARAGEKEAIENNKITIATISHDIKTPVASIRAYSEALQAGMDNNIERRERYVSVIIRKCDEVSKLTNDLFLHSLADMDKLEMHLEDFSSKKLITKILSGIQVDNDRVNISLNIPEIIINADERRLEQVYENIIGNAIKYAPDSKIDITHENDGQYLIAIIRDYGIGIEDEDLPFIFDKFYRGKNANEKPGAGLGLYIVKYIMEQMNGRAEIRNIENGLEAKIYMKKK